MKIENPPLQGENGSDLFGDTLAHTPQNGRPPWSVIVAYGDVTFTTLTDTSCRPTDNSSITLAAGQMVFGTFTEIRLATGKVKAHVGKFQIAGQIG